jgi:uncharacterized protein (DUF608 family)
MANESLSRRDFILTSSSAAGLMIVGAGSRVAQSAIPDRQDPTPNEPRLQTRGTAWSIPSCAWKRSVGDVPKIELLPDPDNGLNTLTRTKKGIPLGGIGAGNFMYNLCGSFGPWHMKAGRYEERFLSQAAFHIREKVEGKDATVRTLATDDVLPAWPRLKPGEGDYYALFPRGWCTYKPFSTNISLQFFSPVIKDNYRETSFPAALFLFRIHNPLPGPARISVMFTFPNAPYTGPQSLPVLEKMMGESGAKSSARARQGLSNEVARDSANGIIAILMKAHETSNPPETEKTEWCIATSSEASYVTAWDGSGDGSDVWEDFAGDGKLANKELSAGSKLPSGALCMEVEVAPESEVTVPFALAWHFPQIEFEPGTRWWRRYTEYFPASQPGQSLEIAREALLHREHWLEAVEAWQDPIIHSPAHPEWLKQGALNELYYATFGGSFWENGCITKPKKFGNRPGQHLTFVMECQEYRLAESFDVRHHPARSNRDLWPENERDILLLFSDFIMDTPDGSCPHDAGGVDHDPLFDYDGCGRDYNNTPKGIKGRITTPWSEFSPKFILQSYAYWHKTKDDKFVDDVWPALVRSFNYQKTTDTDGDGLTEMKSSEYVDNKLFNAILWLAALEALQSLAGRRRESAFLEQVTSELNKARGSTEKEFWNEQLGYYQYNEHNHDIMGDAMIGERYADVTGLPPVVNADRLTSHYRQLFRRAVLPLKDLNGDGIGDMGVANALHPDSTPGVGDSEYTHEFEVWTGVSYCAAANLYHWGKRIGDGSLQADALLAGWGVYYETWANENTAYWFSTPEAWRLEDPRKFRAAMYQRARGIWELAMEVGDPYRRRG